MTIHTKAATPITKHMAGHQIWKAVIGGLSRQVRRYGSSGATAFGPKPTPAIAGTPPGVDAPVGEPLGDDAAGEAASPDVATIVEVSDRLSGFADAFDANGGAQAAAVAVTTALAEAATPTPVSAPSPPAVASAPAGGNPFAGASASRTTAPPAQQAKPATAARPVRTAAAGSGTPARAATSREGNGGTDLLATLLGNIKHSEQSAQTSELSALKRPQTGSDQEALDLLVRQVRERDARVVAARKPVTGASARAGAATAPLSSGQVQAQLRRCPRANTTAGINCRQKVCAKVAGQDAACPKPQ